MTGQERMEAHVAQNIYEYSHEFENTLNGKMQFGNGSCSYEDLSVTLEFPVQDWQLNRGGFIHGGAVCTALDITAGVLARFISGENYAPTLSLDTKYVRPAALGDTLIVTAKATATGKRILQFSCEAISKDKGKTVATGAAIFMNVDTNKEREQK